jgi:2-polyprenyl-3-methyl-5-hydroxy-6-metoxy-1,4-benzoquinol methylase
MSHSSPAKKTPQNAVLPSSSSPSSAPQAASPALVPRKFETFRQTRVANPMGRLKITIGGVAMSLENWSRTGVAFIAPEAPFEVGQSVAGVRIFCEEIPIYEGDIRIRAAQPSRDGQTRYGASFASGLFKSESVESASAVTQCLERAHHAVDATLGACPEFCRSVIALKAVLREIQATCQKEEERARKLPFDSRRDSEQVFLTHMTERFKKIFFSFNEQIARQVDLESLPENSVYHRIFREEIYPFFEGADLVRRAYEKPRGYAGDYEMMNQIYRNGFEGWDLFGRMLHNYIANENSGESVKFRKPYFVGYYNRLLETPGNRRVLSIACGPSVELQEVVSTWSPADLERLHVTLFDLDREALEHAQTKLYELAANRGAHLRLQFINASIKSFLTSHAETHEAYDLIYSAGLFDYLDNLTASALVHKFAGMLNPGGRLIIGNFTKENKTKAFLHLLTAWPLIHKTEPEMRAWAQGLGGVSIEVEYDHLGMHAFLVLRKDAPH